VTLLVYIYNFQLVQPVTTTSQPVVSELVKQLASPAANQQQPLKITIVDRSRRSSEGTATSTMASSGLTQKQPATSTPPANQTTRKLFSNNRNLKSRENTLLVYCKQTIDIPYMEIKMTSFGFPTINRIEKGSFG
jgi:hypothetical protein